MDQHVLYVLRKRIGDLEAELAEVRQPLDVQKLLAALELERRKRAHVEARLAWLLDAGRGATIEREKGVRCKS